MAAARFAWRDFCLAVDDDSCAPIDGWLSDEPITVDVLPVVVWWIGYDFHQSAAGDRFIRRVVDGDPDCPIVEINHVPPPILLAAMRAPFRRKFCPGPWSPMFLCTASGSAARFSRLRLAL